MVRAFFTILIVLSAAAPVTAWADPLPQADSAALSQLKARYMSCRQNSQQPGDDVECVGDVLKQAGDLYAKTYKAKANRLVVRDVLEGASKFCHLGSLLGSAGANGSDQCLSAAYRVAAKYIINLLQTPDDGQAIPFAPEFISPGKTPYAQLKREANACQGNRGVASVGKRSSKKKKR